MKTRFTLDFKVFSLMLKELRIIKRELRNLQHVGSSTATAPAGDSQDKMYSRDVLKALHITTATLIKYEKMGFLKFHREGRNKVYSEAEVLAFRKLKGRRKRISKSYINRKKKK